MANPLRGEVWFVNLNPPHPPPHPKEQAGQRPCLIISDDLFNRTGAGVVIILPITSRFKNIPFHVKVSPPEGGLKVDSYVQCDQIRIINTDRLAHRLGAINFETLSTIERHLKDILSL